MAATHGTWTMGHRTPTEAKRMSMEQQLSTTKHSLATNVDLCPAPIPLVAVFTISAFFLEIKGNGRIELILHVARSRSSESKK
jgi:hypothetical protein